jgi:prepilin-type N-terminal cleavage/methylation domain-containing protein
MRKAFTLLELIVVIAIITVLAGITLLGVRHIMGKMDENETRASLEVCRSMFGVVRDKGYTAPGFWFQDGVAGVYAVPQSPPPKGSFWRLASHDHPTYTALDDLANPSLTDDLFTNTIAAFAHMQLHPEARKMIDSLPAKQLRTYSLPYTYAGNSGTLTAHVLLDAWQNPVVFIPASGYSSGAGQPITTSAGVMPHDPSQWPPVETPPKWPPGKAQSYFLSAGPDGRLSTTADNIILLN